MTILPPIRTREAEMDIRIDPGWLGWIWGGIAAAAGALAAAAAFLWDVAIKYAKALEAHQVLEKRLDATDARVSAIASSTSEALERLGDRFETRFDRLDKRLDEAARG
jgi:hypothetical protein